jgi:hypothetical protein
MCFHPPVPRAKQVAFRPGRRRHHRKCGPVIATAKGGGPAIQVQKGVAVSVTKAACPL